MTIQKRFESFNRQNPAIYTELVRLARVAKVQGVETYSTKAMLEVLRWNFVLRRFNRNPKINNDFTSRYARLIDKQESDLKGFFKTRQLNAK